MEFQDDCEILWDNTESESDRPIDSTFQTQFKKIWQKMDEINEIACGDSTFSSSDISNGISILQGLKDKNPTLSENSSIHIAAFLGYPREFEKSTDKSGLTIDINNHWTKKMLRRVNEIESTNSSISSFGNLIYLNVDCNNDNVRLLLVDSNGELAKTMGLATPEKLKGAVWFTDVWDEVWEYDDCLTLAFFKRLEAKKINVGVDIKPKIVAKSFKEFFDNIL